MQMRQQPVEPGATDIQAPRAWQFDCVDGEGRVLMRGQNLVNLFFRVPSAYHAPPSAKSRRRETPLRS